MSLPVLGLPLAVDLRDGPRAAGEPDGWRRTVVPVRGGAAEPLHVDALPLQRRGFPARSVVMATATALSPPSPGRTPPRPRTPCPTTASAATRRVPDAPAPSAAGGHALDGPRRASCRSSPRRPVRIPFAAVPAPHALPVSGVPRCRETGTSGRSDGPVRSTTASATPTALTSSVRAAHRAVRTSGRCGPAAAPSPPCPRSRCAARCGPAGTPSRPPRAKAANSSGETPPSGPTTSTISPVGGEFGGGQRLAAARPRAARPRSRLRPAAPRPAWSSPRPRPPGSDPAGLLARLAGRGPPLGERLRPALALPLRDAAGRRPGHDRVDAGLGHGLDGEFAAVALGQRLDDGDTGLRLGLLAAPRSTSTTSRSLPSAAAHDAVGPAPAPVGEDDLLAGPQPLHGDGVPPLGAVEDVRRPPPPASRCLDHEHRRGHRTRPPARRQRGLRGGQFGGQHLDQLPGGQLARHPVALPRPQRHALRVPRLGGGLAQRRR